MKKILTVLCLMCLVHTFISAQNKGKELIFKIRYERENFDIVKFQVLGDVSIENSSMIEEKMNAKEGVSNFKFISVEEKDCYAELDKKINFIVFRKLLMEEFLSIGESSSIVVSKSIGKEK